MGLTQSSFLSEFKQSLNDALSHELQWSGGQAAANCAAFIFPYQCRREVGARASERFELGDATASHLGWKIIVEFESKELPLSNLLKYWPYLRGELSTKPEQPVLVCHFSDWWSYATRRDLWEWTLSRMKGDADRLVEIEGRQFDHGGDDRLLRASSIAAAIKWIESTLSMSRPIENQ